MNQEHFLGFRQFDRGFLEGEPGELLLLEHEQTGAHLLYMKNDDENRCFSIAFPTPPLGSTGNCHILEHSVLNGSRKYRTKEPFMDCIKGSLQTFLNAMTYPDKTVYPLASRNGKDFLNLMDLYLDAVFFPRAVEDPLIFRQEGWRYEIHDPQEPLRYAGVVYNEMKGATSSDEDQVDDLVNRYLYRNSIYAENSGGDPRKIPTLRYEDFCRYHKTYYHPSNSYLFLYGAIDEEKTFSLLHRVLSQFTKKDIASEPDLTKIPREAEQARHPYSLAEGENEEGRTFLTQSYLLGVPKNPRDKMLMSLLPDLLVDAESSPLRRRLLEELGAEDVYASLNTVKEPSFTIVAKNTPSGKANLFRQIVQEELEKMVRDGLSRETMEASMNHFAFRIREKEGFANKGIIFALRAYEDWLYGENPLESMDLLPVLKETRQALKEGAMEAFLAQRLLAAPRQVFLELPAQAGRNADLDRQEADRLARYKENLSEEQLRQLIDENQALLDRQNRPDSPEALASLPRLSRKDLPDALPTLPRKVEEESSVRFLLHDLPTAGIHYLNFVFDISHISREEAPLMAMVCELFGRLDTEHFSYQDYENAEGTLTGGITVTPSLFGRPEGEDFLRKLVVSVKFLGDASLDAGLDLVKEQLLHTRWDNFPRIMEQLKIMKSTYQRSFIDQGHRTARDRAMGQISPMAHYNQAVHGLDFYRSLSQLIAQAPGDLPKRLEEMAHRLFLSDRRLVNLTTQGSSMTRLKEKSLQLLWAFPTAPVSPAPAEDVAAPRSEAYSMSSEVNYCALAARLPKDFTYRGSLAVLLNWLNNEPIYSEIRAKGGAYGCGAQVSYKGKFTGYSYRDPHIQRTFQTFRELPEKVKNLTISEADLTRYIIGSVGAFDPPMTEEQKGMADLGLYLQGRPLSYYNELLQEMKRTKPEDFSDFPSQLADALQHPSLVVFGNPQAIEKNKELFEHTEPLP